MKVGVSYNLFDGEELLEGSIKSIRESVDYVSVVYQTISNFGDAANDRLVPLLNKLKEEGLIDELFEFRPNVNKGGHFNELNKRNIGIALSQGAGCTHHMSMDSDEFYVKEQFEYMKKVMVEGNYDSSACQMVTYYKEFIYRLEPKEEYFVSGIHKISVASKYIYAHQFPVLVDPTRRVSPGNFRKFSREEIEMHHMSYIRDDIFKKLNNSSARGNFKNINKLVNHYNKWEYPQQALLGGIPEKLSDIVKVENLFPQDENKFNNLNYVDKIYCVNLDRRLDRWEETKVEMKRLGLEDRVFRYSAVDGKLVENKSKLLPGEYGLIVTHINILNEAIENGYENILIFEDDVEFINDFIDIDKYFEKVPNDWDIIYLGGNHIQRPRPLNDRISRVTKTYTTHAMLVNRKCFKNLVDELSKFSAQLDVIYTNLRLKLYTCTPSIATQRVSFSDIQGYNADYTKYIK